MAILPIRTYPDPILAQKSAPVTEFDDSVSKIVEDMKQTMQNAPGIGLAAVQVGIAKRILIFDAGQAAQREDEGEGEGEHNQDQEQEKPSNIVVCINPVITSAQGSVVSENEGCLSVPELRANVTRSACVRAKAFDENGAPFDLDLEGMAAIVFQHELDHLEGVLFLERISRLKRDLYKRRVRKWQKDV
ncbi:MAG: peptide deformylase [Desulfatibacillaceae bacterium]|nr:peptide deformylase [Desulfatibacillaceae bacterium]